MRKTTILLLSGLWSLGQLISSGCTPQQSAEEGSRAERKEETTSKEEFTQAPATTESESLRSSTTSGMGDFVAASKAATPAVVHIKTTYQAAEPEGYGQYYGYPAQQGPAMASGSGVLISSDGYIATNNHVVENASAIQVILPDKRQYPAKLVGRDPNTDLALLKISAEKLPSIKLGNSDNVQVGEWVVAVGYPFSLNTTVTAGIVSAKARSIGIINRPSGNQLGGGEPAGNTGIESFIQTDAAINPGNSGGALVNTSGELIGINSAIASQTGSYAGYAFAIPVNLATKILNDLRKFGSVQRGVLGVAFPTPTAEAQYLQQKGLQPGAVQGVYITGVQSNSAAAAAGLRAGDIIQRIDDVTLNSSAEFSERIARHRPGDEVKLTYLRDNSPRSVSVTLKGESTPTAKGDVALERIYEKLGASFAPLPAALKQRLSLRAGVLVTQVREGGFFDQVGVPRGTIIAFINGKPVDTPQDVDAALLAAQQGIIQIMAIAPDGSKVAFDFSLGT